MQGDLFGPSDADPAPKHMGKDVVRLQLLVTVKAAPNPSERYGETVCVAGLSTDLNRRGWVRLHPINFRDLEMDDSFAKYDMISVDAIPAAQDLRRESWRPRMSTIRRIAHLPPWKQRRPWLDPYVEDSMCRLNRDARADAGARSLGLVRPRDVSGLKIIRHPGWSTDQQRKIDAYVNQLDLFGERDRTPLAAPRFQASYQYRCHDPACHGHEQGMIDWEFVALQRRLGHLSDDEVRRELSARFLTMMCDQNRDLAFFVGNQAKRTHVFSVLGVYYPKR